MSTSNKYKELAARALGITTGSTNPVVKILHLRNADNDADQPSVNDLEYGQIAVNYQKGNEKIMIKNNENEIIEIKPFTEYSDDISDALNELQDQIDTINGGTSVDGSFAHADQVLHDLLLAEIEKFVGVATNTIEMYVNPTSREISANVKLSSKEGNDLSIQDDGLYAHTSQINGGTF